MTRAEFAALIRVTPDRVTKLIAEGMPVAKTGGGRGHETELALDQALPWLFRRSTGSEDKSRLDRLNGDKVLLEIRRRKGELVEADQVEASLSGLVIAARERLLAIPVLALQRQLITPEAEDALIGLVHEALAELAGVGDTP